MSEMEYNKCSTCGAGDGRAGLCYGHKDSDILECKNCHDTRKSGDVCIHMHLSRTDEELQKTMTILNE